MRREGWGKMIRIRNMLKGIKYLEEIMVDEVSRSERSEKKTQRSPRETALFLNALNRLRKGRL